MNELDDDIRRAFAAVRLDPSVRARLEQTAPAPKPSWTGRIVLAAAIVLAVGLAAVPAAEVVWQALPAGLALRGAEHVDLPMDPLDLWIPEGSLVDVIGVSNGWEEVHGTQRLIRSGVRMDLELLDPEAWGSGPVGTVRLSRVAGPLRETAVSTEGFDVGPDRIGEVGYCAVDGCSTELVALGSGFGIMRTEGPSTSGPHVEFAVPVGNEVVSNVVAGPMDVIPGTTPEVRVYDATTGASVGLFHRAGSYFTKGLMEDVALGGGLSLDDRSVRLALPDGDHTRIGVAFKGWVAVGDRLDLYDASGPGPVPVAWDVEVVEVLDGGARVRVPVRQMPGVVRATRVQARVRKPTGARMAVQAGWLPERDLRFAESRNVELVALSPDGAFALGPSELVAYEPGGGASWRVTTALPDGFGPITGVRAVRRTGAGMMIALATHAPVAGGQVALVGDEGRVRDLYVLRQDRDQTLVLLEDPRGLAQQAFEERLSALLHADDGALALVEVRTSAVRDPSLVPGRNGRRLPSAVWHMVRDEGYRAEVVGLEGERVERLGRVYEDPVTGEVTHPGVIGDPGELRRVYAHPDDPSLPVVFILKRLRSQLPPGPVTVTAEGTPIATARLVEAGEWGVALAVPGADLEAVLVANERGAVGLQALDP